MAGYENNDDANRDAFISGWFRTGDEGYVDSDGYVFLTGRLKEQINRGGEKISPLEVDSALLTHPEVQQAVTFAIPHDKLGEEVGAAVVLSSEGAVTATELREFLAEHLAAFKVPRKILFLEELPKGPTGKLQRIGLASRLGLEA
jgi:acyl-CoA synthetase (AMP-forming)/AMP-acid ligase II